MSLQRPTLQGQKGYNPKGLGPGVNHPYGYSAGYRGGLVKHNGQDYFWLSEASARSLGITVNESKNVYPPKAGTVYPVDSPGLGIGAYIQLDSSTRMYFWHLERRIYNAPRHLEPRDRLGIMGSTGSATSEIHLHLEVRKAPYRDQDRVDPEPYFKEKPVQNPRSRTVRGSVPKVNGRTAPTTSAEVRGQVSANYSIVMNAVQAGERVTVDGVTSTLWYRRSADNLWYAGAAFTTRSNTGLPDVTPKPPPPAPAPEPLPLPELEPVEPEPEPAEPEPEPIAPEPVTPEQEQAAVQLAHDLVTGKLETGSMAISRIRTLTPLLAGPVIAILVTNFPSIADLLTQAAPGWEELITAGLSAALGFGYWQLARWLGNRWPLVEKIMLGSSKHPVYLPPAD